MLLCRVDYTEKRLLKHLFILFPVSSLTLSETHMEETIKLGFVKEEIFIVDS